MSNFESARYANQADLHTFKNLFEESRKEASTYKASDIWLANEALRGPPEVIFQDFLSSDCKTLLIGEFDAYPVGFMLIQLFPLDNNLLARVEEVYVDSEARKVGVGEHMMDEAIKWAKDQGASQILGRTFPGDRHTKNFFERFKELRHSKPSAIAQRFA